MCGRYTLRRYDLLKSGLRAQPGFGFEEFVERPRFNIAPTQLVPIVRLNKEHRELLAVKWGFVLGSGSGKPFLSINARAETVASNPAFRGDFVKHRCLVPADGFYEWKKINSAKQPMFIHFRGDDLFCFAGLYHEQTMTIITTEPNETMKPIHNRMPVILHESDYEKWLDEKTPVKDLRELLAPFDGKLATLAVSSHVNSPKHDDPECIEPATVSARASKARDVSGNLF
jgi:putative SOS response-associated peptidase YedK